MHWITRNRNIAFSVGSRPAKAYEDGEISFAQMRARHAEMVSNPPEFPDLHSEAGWRDGVEFTASMIAKSV